MSALFSITGLLLSLCMIYVAHRLLDLRKGKLPPGPRGLPIIGNLLQLKLDAWLPFTEWKHKYGPLVYISVGNQGILIVNSHKAAVDLLDQRAHIYNNRPRFIVAGEYLTGGKFLGILQNNDVWRRMRRAGNEVLNKAMATSFQPVQEREGVRLVWNMLQSTRPQEWEKELKRAAQSLTLSMVYNLPTLEAANDPAIQRINEFVLRITQATFPGTYLVEYFPWLKYLPAFISKWKSDAQMWYRRDTELFRSLYDGVRDRMIEDEDAHNSFTSHVIRGQERYDLSDTEISWLSANMYSGGSDASATTLEWFMLAMITYPEVQRKCQEELDSVVGRSRMPRFSDQDVLPYIRATAREVMRWRTIAPLGAPHQSTEDDWYEGYYIPKNTIVMPNIWAMNRDKDVYGPDAEIFKPERHLDPDGNLASAPPDTKPSFLTEGNVSFGYGGRTCPGKHVANSSVFINIASILWAGIISPDKDESGVPVKPDLSDTATINNGIAVRPLPFKCLVTPRFPEVPEVLAQTKEMLGI
ncbi:cytochrome P450 [Dendrothele bispora CBS 962.96]|uniref:Cytochrome P450 n=1 Tax=Dendrothele bispora (strain CBS 962.96) TaxID=1314807 RepID=A0A4S8M7F9_DENBC|nr:cytochrome P450 [Dendrothele bispora CBS 962.96]